MSHRSTAGGPSADAEGPAAVEGTGYAFAAEESGHASAARDSTAEASGSAFATEGPASVGEGSVSATKRSGSDPAPDAEGSDVLVCRFRDKYCKYGKFRGEACKFVHAEESVYLDPKNPSSPIAKPPAYNPCYLCVEAAVNGGPVCPFVIFARRAKALLGEAKVSASPRKALAAECLQNKVAIFKLSHILQRAGMSEEDLLELSKKFHFAGLYGSNAEKLCGIYREWSREAPEKESLRAYDTLRFYQEWLEEKYARKKGAQT